MIQSSTLSLLLLPPSYLPPAVTNAYPRSRKSSITVLPNFVNDPSSRRKTEGRKEGGRKERGILLYPFAYQLSIKDPVLRIVLTRSFHRSCLSSRSYRNGDNWRRCWKDKYLVTENVERKFNSFFSCCQIYRPITFKHFIPVMDSREKELKF